MNYNQNGSGGYPNGDIPGKNKAIASLVLGIISVVLWFFGYSSILHGASENIPYRVFFLIKIFIKC